MASGRRDRQQAGNAAAADVVDPREHHIVALDLDHDRRGQALAVELAQRHGEVGGMAVPADGEVRTERDLRRALRPADRDLPLAALRRYLLLLVELLTQLVRSLLEGEPPVIQHETIVGGAYGAGDMVEM